MKENKTHTISLRVSDETYKYLQKLAKVNNSTVSDVVRWKIEKPKTFKELRETTIRETQGYRPEHFDRRRT